MFCDEREAVQGNALAVICPTMWELGNALRSTQVGISGKIL